MKTLYRSKTHWNQYRSPSARAAWWDYGSNGAYFVTICTKHKYPFFGELINGEMQLSKIGQIAQSFWLQIPEMTLPGVHLEAFSIMPNHIHGVLVLDRPKGEEPLREQPTVETVEIPSLPEPSPISPDPLARQTFFKSIAPRKGSLSHIIRKFKGLVTKTVRDLGHLERTVPLWQPRFYDRIIRTPKELERIVEYILEQPSAWANDDYHCPPPPPQKESSVKRSSTNPPKISSPFIEQTTTLKARCKAWWDKWRRPRYTFSFPYASKWSPTHWLSSPHWTRRTFSLGEAHLPLFRLNPI